MLFSFKLSSFCKYWTIRRN